MSAPADSTSKMWGVFCLQCDSQDPHHCSRYMCDYRVKHPRGKHTVKLAWQQHYDKQKRDQGEAAAKRKYRAMSKLLGPNRQMVCTDTSSEGQRIAIEDQFPGHIMAHVPAPTAIRPMTREMKERLQKIEDERRRLEHLHNAERRTPLKMSKLTHWSQLSSLKYEKMVQSKIQEYNESGKVFWPLNDKDVNVHEDVHDVCKETPLDMKVCEWPGDYLKPRSLVIWSNCPPSQAQAPGVTPPCTDNALCDHEGLIGSANCVVSSTMPDRRMAKRRTSELQTQTRAHWDPDYAPYYSDVAF